MLEVFYHAWNIWQWIFMKYVLMGWSLSKDRTGDTLNCLNYLQNNCWRNELHTSRYRQTWQFWCRRCSLRFYTTHTSLGRPADCPAGLWCHPFPWQPMWVDAWGCYPRTRPAPRTHYWCPDAPPSGRPSTPASPRH